MFLSNIVPAIVVVFLSMQFGDPSRCSAFEDKDLNANEEISKAEASIAGVTTVEFIARDGNWDGIWNRVEHEEWLQFCNP